jgi:stearoyl-CoA desaturase (Delta-9 desaturase)
MAFRDGVTVGHPIEQRRHHGTGAPRTPGRCTIAAERLPHGKINPRTSIPFFLVHLLPLLAIFTGVTWTAVILFMVTYWGRMFFITAGYHRYFAHRAFRTGRVFQFILAFGGCMSAQKGPLWWAGHHR